MNFLNRVVTNTQKSNLMKILPVEAELFHADRWTVWQTDVTKLIVVFHSFVKTLKTIIFYNQN